jgi:hypothetical protein
MQTPSAAQALNNSLENTFHIKAFFFGKNKI